MIDLRWRIKNVESECKVYTELSLGDIKLTRRDILVIEKLLRIYADAYEKNEASSYGQTTKPLRVRKHMPRKYADMNVVFNGVRADSIKFLPKGSHT